MAVQQEKQKSIVSVTHQDNSNMFWYQAYQEPVGGSSLILEVELSDDESQSEQQIMNVQPS